MCTVSLCSLHVYRCLSSLFNCLDMCTCDRLWSWELTRTPWMAQGSRKHVPCCHTSAHGSGTCCCVYGPRVLLVLWSSVAVIGWKNVFSDWTSARSSWCINKRWLMKQERHELQFSNMPRNAEMHLHATLLSTQSYTIGPSPRVWTVMSSGPKSLGVFFPLLFVVVLCVVSVFCRKFHLLQDVSDELVLFL